MTDRTDAVERAVDSEWRPTREIVAREWVVDRGKFTPVYESRRRAQ